MQQGPGMFSHSSTGRKREWTSTKPTMAIRPRKSPRSRGRSRRQELRLGLGRQRCAEGFAARGAWGSLFQCPELAMGQKPLPPMNIPIPTKIDQNGWCTNPKMVRLALTHNQFLDFQLVGHRPFGKQVVSLGSFQMFGVDDIVAHCWVVWTGG